MSTSDPIVIVSAVRTPLGRFQGDLASLSASKLGAHAIRAAIERAGIAAEKIDEVLFGNVLTAGQGQAPARQAARAAGLPDSTGASTINKVCGSGMKATFLAHDLLGAHSADIIVAGGMESMSNAPYLLPKARSGYRAGHDRIIDHMLLDGLEDAYEQGRSMGDFGEATAEAYQFTRADQDAFATETLTRAQGAIRSGAFRSEIAPITIAVKDGDRIVADDENPMKVSPEKVTKLRPAFRPNGTITAASSSANADGAAALILTRRSIADRDHLPVLATIRAHATHSQEPAWFTTAPIPAIRKVLAKAGWDANDVDLYEINEAFASQCVHVVRALGIDESKVNVNGGGIALGHPLGCTGTKLTATLVHELRRRGGGIGVVSMCIGGGMGAAGVFEVHA